MIKNLYKDYFQKSKTFLYPALQISRRSSIQVSQTFTSWEGMYTKEDMKLVLVYENTHTAAFKAFETKVLLSNPMFFTHFTGTDNTKIYVFDFSILKKDWDNFHQGKYSKLSKELKKSILSHFGKSSPEYEYVVSYIFPEEYFDQYATLLDVKINIIEKVGELCDLYNQEKETCKILVEHLEVSAKFV